MYKVTVLGGGPAGMTAAYAAASAGASVTLIEQNDILGKKLLITGKGRCNVTNFAPEDELISQVVTNPKFLYSAFSAFSAYDAYAFFEEWGVPLKIERGNRVFPESDRAADVRNAFKKAMDHVGVRVENDRILSILADPFVLKGERNTYNCDKLIIATGGVSYPLTGSTGDGYRFAQNLGHRLIKPSAALVPLLEKGTKCRGLMGLSLKNVQLTVFDCKGKELYKDFGEMLFTHEGISGPIVLSASSHLSDSNFPCYAEIDLKPALDTEALDRRILRDFDQYINKDFRNALDKLLPKKMISSIIASSGIAPDAKIHQITKEQRERLIYVIKHLRIDLAKKGDFSEAIITSGGVDVKQVDPRTMESKICKDLYFAGEVLDVDALTGGYNLQIAYSTGYLAGCAAAKER